MSTCECKVDMLSAMMCDTSINSLQTLHIYLEVSTFTDNISLFPLFSVTFCSNPLSQSWGFFPFVIIKLNEINFFVFIIYYQKLFQLMKIFFPCILQLLYVITAGHFIKLIEFFQSHSLPFKMVTPCTKLTNLV